MFWMPHSHKCDDSINKVDFLIDHNRLSSRMIWRNVFSAFR